MSTLKEKLERIRDLSSQLNAKTDEATRIVKSVERFLKECGAGLRTKHRYCLSPDYAAYVVYGRVNGIFCIHSLICHKDPAVGSVVTAYDHCDRATKLEIFAAMPGLLAAIVDQADSTMRHFDEAAPRVAEWLSEFGIADA